MNHMMKDVLLFLITFAVIMIAFSSGVSYIFNMASGKRPKRPKIKLKTIKECNSKHTTTHDFDIHQMYRDILFII